MKPWVLSRGGADATGRLASRGLPRSRGRISRMPVEDLQVGYLRWTPAMPAPMPSTAASLCPQRGDQTNSSTPHPSLTMAEDPPPVQQTRQLGPVVGPTEPPLCGATLAASLRLDGPLGPEGHPPSRGLFLEGLLVVVLFMAAGNWINAYFDVVEDRINRPDRAIVDRTVKRGADRGPSDPLHRPLPRGHLSVHWKLGAPDSRRRSCSGCTVPAGSPFRWLAMAWWRPHRFGPRLAGLLEAPFHPPALRTLWWALGLRQLAPASPWPGKSPRTPRTLPVTRSWQNHLPRALAHRPPLALPSSSSAWPTRPHCGLESAPLPP